MPQVLDWMPHPARQWGGLRRLTFELTPTAEAGAVSRDGDDSTFGAGPAYGACRSGSGVERVVRPHWPRGPRTTTARVRGHCHLASRWRTFRTQELASVGAQAARLPSRLPRRRH